MAVHVIGIFVGIGFWAIVGVGWAIREYVRGLAQDQVMKRRPDPWTAAVGLLLVWLLLGIIAGVAIVAIGLALRPSPEVNGDPLPRDLMPSQEMITVGVLVIVGLTLFGPYATLPVLRRWRRFTGPDERTKARAFLALADPVRGPVVRGGRIDVPSAGVSMELPMEWHAFDMTDPSVRVAALEVERSEHEVIERILQNPPRDAKHLVHAYVGSPTPRSVCDVVTAPGVPVAQSGWARLSVEAACEMLERLSSWRETSTKPRLWRNHLGDVRATKVEFKCVVGPHHHHWDAVGYLVHEGSPRCTSSSANVPGPGAPRAKSGGTFWPAASR